MWSPYLTTVADFRFPTPNITYLLTEAGISGVFMFNITNQLVSNSLCHISSLEVYRGREQAIEISHKGFSLSENGSIEVKLMEHNNIIMMITLLSRSI